MLGETLYRNKIQELAAFAARLMALFPFTRQTQQVTRTGKHAARIPSAKEIREKWANRRPAFDAAPRN
jgi:hypothetical protein